MKRLGFYWFLWRRFGVTPWQYRRDVAAVRNVIQTVLAKPGGGIADRPLVVLIDFAIMALVGAAIWIVWWMKH